MWRTSWLSREVIVLPAFIARRRAVVGGACGCGASPPWTRFALPLAALGLAALLWLCTAMIYACLRFIEEWAHPLTLVELRARRPVLRASCSLRAAARLGGEGELLRAGAVRRRCSSTILAGGARLLALRRNARIRHRSTLQSATGIAAARLVQKSMGMSAGSFNTREFFHRASAAGDAACAGRCSSSSASRCRRSLAALGLATSAPWPWLAAAALQVPGLVVDRWFFFAQAKHPQNLYYQVVS